jgi:chemotaxis protein MotB
VHFAVSPSLIERVTGYADTRPIDGEKSDSEANQRITLSLTVGSQPKFKDGKLVEKPVTAIAAPVAASLRPTS